MRPTPWNRRARLRAGLFMLSLLAVGAQALAGADPRMALMSAMEVELDRNTQRLTLPGYEPPYFLSYQLTDVEDRGIYAKFGALFDARGGRKRMLYVETRVGSYDRDNTNIGAFDFDPNQVQSPYVTTEAPADDDPAALRQRLWLLTDETYKEALSGYLRKQGKSVYEVEKAEEEDVPSFSRAEAARHIEPPRPLVFDEAIMKERARGASAIMRRYPGIFDGGVTISARKVTRYYVNSEGTRLLTESVLYSVTAEATARADDGMLLQNAFTRYYQDPAALPDGPALNAMVQGLVDELLALKAAPVLEPYTGPAILAPEATGVLFHESIGHRLEGERQDQEEEGQTFKGQLGSQIVPPFISLIDDPTLKSWEGVALNGTYAYDEEGVAAQPVTLVEDGVLKTFLMSRSPVEGVYESNGHGRGAGVYDPMARMGNFQVRSSNAVPEDKLKAMLMEECRRQDKPYGLLIQSIEGGSTNTSAYGYQAFKGSPRLVYKVDAQTGEETLVRGVEMVGTPLTVIGKLIATGERSEVFNGFCGAESGYVPVSTIAPAVLLSEIELQRSHGESARLPILPSPFEEGQGSGEAGGGDPEPPRRKRGGR